ncbi:DUF1007 family protein [Balneatrix alpica]|uniref:DUF1007 family protein n=1 Tax=Balneatrix alpica TaxID=75684 RepID=A0ABV5ZBB4_9GAMM|nr:DUF1007 family protein [Balneatrix alpica]
MKMNLGLIGALLTGLLGQQVQAHPHVFIDYQVKWGVASEQLREVEVDWVLDPFTSTNVISQFDLNADGMIDSSEQAEVETFIKEVFAEGQYFLQLYQGDKPVALANLALAGLKPSMEGVSFTLLIEPAEAIALDQLRLAFWDPENYFDFAPAPERAWTWRGEAGNCQVKQIAPMDALDKSWELANWMQVACGKAS